MSAETYGIVLLQVICALLGGMGSVVNERVNVQEKIIGGVDTDIQTFPFMLSLMIHHECACGASILNSRWGLTAAHCIEAGGRNPRAITIRSGSNYCDRDGVLHAVTKATIHEKYDSGTADYDIAVFRASPRFGYDVFTQPISLPDHTFTSADTMWAIVAGWGYDPDFEEGTKRKTLQSVMVPKVSREECVRDYRNEFAVTPRQVCYGFREGGKDACKGDSGGPLFTRQTVIGVTSWGNGCALPRSPGVYTDTILLADWVRNKTESAPGNFPVYRPVEKPLPLPERVLFFVSDLLQGMGSVYQFLRNCVRISVFLFRSALWVALLI